jgi:hypothetical protein
MKQFAIVAAGFLLVSQVASGATWSAIGVAVQPMGVPGVVAATDALMGSAAGKEFPGRLFLQQNVADGDNPATHAFVPVYKSAAEGEAWIQKLQADPAWPKFQEALAKLSDPVSTVRYRTQKRWGTVSDTDMVWQVHSFQVRDVAAFTAALDAFLASPTGKKFPGQVFLSNVVAGGLTPVTHVVSVGLASEAALESWQDDIQGSSDFEAYLAKSRKAADYLGNDLVRTLKTWGAPLDDVTAN